jgi:DNA-directed RNA polymerase subunit H (RpoH/RPB5)
MGETNFLIPKHKKLKDSEVAKILEKHSIQSIEKLPKIKARDPALSDLDIQIGDVIEITRHSFVGETKYYRVVIE